jgi:1,4-dihydroxy-2-naphthoyl-CoA hydrolase
MYFKEYTLEELAWMEKNTIHESLGIEITELGKESLSGKMPCDNKTVQPFRLLHGGANVVLAESLGSLASSLIVNPETHYAVGLNINASHMRPVKEGYVYGKAEPVHIGRTTHIWNIDITNEKGKLVCNCRLTMAIVAKP